MGKKSAPSYPTSTVKTGLFGKTTTSSSGSTFKPTKFQKQLVGVTTDNAVNALSNYLNPDYESADYKRGDEYYTNKMNTQLQNNYLAPMLSKNLLRGSTSTDIMRGFAKDLADAEYERQNDYRNQQLQNYMAAMLPYTTIYDMMKGTTGLSNSLNNSIANYNMQKAQMDSQSSGLGGALGGLGPIMQGIGQNAQTVAAVAPMLAASDIRLKENLEKLAEVDGVNIYKFDYKDGAKNQVGVIAQEIKEKYPECVVLDGEFYKVDYSKLPVNVQDKIKELGGS